MKNKILKTLTIATVVTLFSACGGGGGSSDETTTPTTIDDVVLSSSQSLVCTTATDFTVEPTDNPVVTFSTDADSGDTTISVSEDSTGFATVKNCTKR